MQAVLDDRYQPPRELGADELCCVSGDRPADEAARAVRASLGS
jgi:hypothetical protein